jgi:integrase
LSWSKQQHRPKTYELHSGNCKTLKRFLRSKWLDEITLRLVEDFKLARMKERRWGKKDGPVISAVTVNRALATLRLLFNYAGRCGHPFNDIARIILDTGMRPDEVFRIEFANIDFSQRSIFNAFGKTAAARRTLTDEVFMILRKRAVNNRSRYAFPSQHDPNTPIKRVHKAHYRALERAQIKTRFILYDLRHTYDSRAARTWISQRSPL